MKFISIILKWLIFVGFSYVCISGSLEFFEVANKHDAKIDKIRDHILIKRNIELEKLEQGQKFELNHIYQAHRGIEISLLFFDKKTKVAVDISKRVPENGTLRLTLSGKGYSDDIREDLKLTELTKSFYYENGYRLIPYLFRPEPGKTEVEVKVESDYVKLFENYSVELVARYLHCGCERMQSGFMNLIGYGILGFYTIVVSIIGFISFRSKKSSGTVTENCELNTEH